MWFPWLGYMVARVLGAAPVLADAIIDQLAAPSDKATNAGTIEFLCAQVATWQVVSQEMIQIIIVWVVESTLCLSQHQVLAHLPPNLDQGGRCAERGELLLPAGQLLCGLWHAEDTSNY